MVTASPAPDYPAEVPPPVLFNIWKHHAAAARHHIRKLAAGGDAALQELAGQLRVVGSELMDLYLGDLTPVAIAENVIAALQAANCLELVPYRAWLTASGGYGVVTFPEDGTQWVPRMGDEAGRYVHLHPGRRAPQTRRVRANVLKTAILVQAYAAIHGGDPLNIARINLVREQYLGLSPIARLNRDDGLGAVLKELGGLHG